MSSIWTDRLKVLLLFAMVALLAACGGSNFSQGRQDLRESSRSASADLDEESCEYCDDDEESRSKSTKKKKKKKADDYEEGEEDSEGEDDRDDDADGEEDDAEPKVPIRSVLIIGDSYFARLRGDGGISDHLRSRSSYTVVDKAVSGAKIDGIRKQYDSHRKPGQYEAVIFNGGGNDFLAGCILASAGCSKTQSHVLQGIESLAQKIQADGVPYIIYLGYHDMVLLKSAADPTLAAIRDKLAPRNGFHFVDIRPAFAGKHGTYIEGDQIHPTEEGSAVIADLLLQKMEELQK